MLDFFKKIMPNFSTKKNNEQSNNDSIKLYLDRKKKTFIPIKIRPDSTCQEIHSAYHSEILSDISQLYSASNYNNPAINQFSKNFNSKDYNFIIIDDENRFIEIKMKEIDYPMKYMLKPSFNLYYLNIGKELRKESFDSELNSYSINNASRSRKITESNKNSNSLDPSQSSIIDNNEESIREGDLMKFSNKKKCFEKRKVMIDKKKLIIEKKSKNDAIILLLRDIKLITRDTKNPIIDPKEKYIFEITTMEGEKLIFKSKNNADFVSWLETMEGLVNLIRDNELILYFEENIRKEIKDINDKGKQILIDCLSLRGILSIYETRQIFFKFYDNPLITNLVEFIINYKINVKFYKYKEALFVFKKIVDYIDIDNLDVNLFHNQLHFDFNNSNSDRKRYDIANKEKNSNFKRKYTISDIKSRNVIFDSKSNTFNTEGVLNLSTNEAINFRTDYPESNPNDDLNINLKNGPNNQINISTRKNSSLNQNTNGTSNISGKEIFLSKNPDKSSEILNTKESPNTTILQDSTGTRNELFSKIEKDENVRVLNVNEAVMTTKEDEEKANLIKDSSLTSNKDFKENLERKANMVSILKSIMTIDIIMSLKVLKNEIKEYFDKYTICVFGPSNNIDFTVIGVQEQNTKFTEFLKLGIFNDIYENILSKYFNEFYKTIFTDKEFLGSLEKILVHYFKVNNELHDNDTKIINFNDVIKTYAQKQ